ncbi:MAG: hypothetical protein IH861_04165 [Chloroflexi bacterium]|nr:hypothetical protein [Chloroflexota bacterium]
MFTFAIDYFLLVFVSGICTIQIACTFSRLTGLLFMKSAAATRLLGASIIVTAFVWFFSVADRNLNDYEGGLDSNEQGLLFFFAIVAAGAFTFLSSSIVNRRMGEQSTNPGTGLGALEESSYFRAVRTNIDLWRKNWRTQTRRYFSGSMD